MEVSHQITYYKWYVFDEVLRGEAELHAALTGRDIDLIVDKAGLVNIRREGLLHPYRTTAATNITGEGQQFFLGDRLARLIAARVGCLFQIDLIGSWHNTNEMLDLVTFQNDGLEHGIDVLT